METKQKQEIAIMMLLEPVMMVVQPYAKSKLDILVQTLLGKLLLALVLVGME
jgi:hypothetical protein